MGLLKRIFKAVVNAGIGFTPDFTKSEYDNWLEFLSIGGTTNEWDSLKRLNNWNFKKDDTAIYADYQKEIKTVSDKYYSLMEKIQRNWSILYNSKDYTGCLAAAFEKDCLEDISFYKKMHEIDLKYGESSPQNALAFRRLAMLYEKQGRFEESASICKEALLCGVNERDRMLRMIKKAGRSPTPEEETVLNKFNEIFITE